MNAIKKYITSGVVIAMSLLAVSVAFAADSKPVFYPSDVKNPRIQFLSTIDGEGYFGSNSSFGNRFPGYNPDSSVKEKAPFGQTYGLASTQDELFICDVTKQQVMIFNFKTSIITKFGEGLSKPAGIAIDTDGTRYVVDLGNMRISVYNAKNAFVRNMTDAQGWYPVSAAILNDSLYVVDTKNHQVVVMNKNTGVVTKRIGQPGEEVGEFAAPSAITVGSNGLIYVSNTHNGRVDVIDANGKFVDKFGDTPNVAAGSFARPKGIAFDKENRLYVVDNSFENVQIFNDKKQFLMPFGEVGNVKGGLNLPMTILVDYNNAKYFSKYVAPGHSLEYVILVANQTGPHKISVFGFLKQ
ncbi:MAG: hypothetical protein A2X86_21435 [Bdellovibrionales bacterium GWA2_49_15]|nr:MAG: hypothetical protein A2X86_21435 [Bdellovibrionales bacterium GWA2_49_15]HAZ14943.1 hypothetical protein [Bdellovibrionales bacterium]